MGRVIGRVCVTITHVIWSTAWCNISFNSIMYYVEIILEGNLEFLVNLALAKLPYNYVAMNKFLDDLDIVLFGSLARLLQNSKFRTLYCD